MKFLGLNVWKVLPRSTLDTRRCEIGENQRDSGMVDDADLDDFSFFCSVGGVYGGGPGW